MSRSMLRYTVLAMLCLACSCNGTTVGGDTGDGGMPDLAPEQPLDVQPAALQTITIAVGQQMSATPYVATLGGQPVMADWSLDRGDVGTIPAGPATSGTFVTRGTSGGLVTVRVRYGSQTVARQILVRLNAQQNGPNAADPGEQAQIPTSVGQLTASGGVGGVGGEGLGPAVTDANTLSALQNPQSSGQAQNFTLLYPYNGTVWPRGLLAPLLMWQWSVGDADAVRIELSSTSGSFTWTGTFGRPAILTQTGGPFIRHPIPQDVWTMATNSAGGPTPGGQADRLTVKVTIARAGMGYGPLTQTWTVAPAHLSGIIYYNSYGTLLAQNSGGAVGGNKMFGGAILSIHVGDTGPKLVAGASGGDAQCRVCHSVAANGSQLVVQQGNNYGVSSAYSLTPTGATETVMQNGATFPAVFPDGSMVLSRSGQLIPLPSGSNPLPVSGLSAVATDVGTPAFAPSGKLVAFNPLAGPGLTNPAQKLLVMSFDAMTHTFSKPVVVVDDTGQPAQTRPGWPAVFPDGQSVVFHHQTASGYDGNADAALWTRGGARAHISWTGVTGSSMVTPLNQLNGRDAAGQSYLPKLAAPRSLTCTADGNQVGGIDADHANDVTLNYEPTVNPVASGGYAWVVFTSRRMYGNLATLPPFCSDPRGVDLVQNITTKKLWVAAIDVTGKLATDASHPAFYLPAQELLAGNSRGFWVLDPCKADGLSCQTGDQCCNGYCQPNSGGALVCGSAPANQCAAVQEKCTTASCCDTTNLCINGFCTQQILG